MVENEFLKEARDAVSKGLNAGYTVETLIRIIDDQDREIENLQEVIDEMRKRNQILLSCAYLTSNGIGKIENGKVVGQKSGRMKEISKKSFKG